MPKRHAHETVLARWTIDEPLWRGFVIAKRTLDERHPSRLITLVPPPEFPVPGVEVVIRDDAIFVGDSCVRSLLPHRGVVVHDSVLEFSIPSDEGDAIAYVLPIARPALADVTRVVEGFIAADAEAARLREEEEARPTVPNRLAKWVNAHPALKWTERHFALVLLAFFFGVIPLCVWLISVVAGMLR